MKTPEEFEMIFNDGKKHLLAQEMVSRYRRKKWLRWLEVWSRWMGLETWLYRGRAVAEWFLHFKEKMNETQKV